MIGESDKIDFVITDKEKTHVILVITDHLDWEEFDEGHHLELLQEKINTYLFYAVDSGQLAENRPDLIGLPVTISVAAKYAPSEEGLKSYRLAGKAVADAGCSLELEMPKSKTKVRF